MLTCSVKSSQTSALNIAINPFEQWVVWSKIIAYLLSEYRNQLVSKFFPTYWTYLAVKRSKEVAYHLQCNGKVEGFNEKIIPQFQQYVVKYERGWEKSFSFERARKMCK